VALREITLDDVLEAGRVLFGPGFGGSAVHAAGWNDDLRSAFRRRVLETHPDRARVTGRSESDLVREFHAVNEACHLLSSLKGGPLPPAFAVPPWPPSPPEPAPRAARPARPPRPAGAAPEQTARAGARTGPRASPWDRAATAATSEAEPGPAAADRRSGPPRESGLPRRRLRFAEFLYYSGRVPWTAFVEAIAWQRLQRPAVGRIAVQFGFLTQADVAEIMARRRSDGAQGEPFGEYAVRRGWLTSVQLLAVLGQQLRLQRPIGAFFVERGLLAEDEIDDIRRTVSRHNSRWAA
jgi:hypothetical protein